MNLRDMRTAAEAIARSAIDAVKPEPLVRAVVSLEDSRLTLGNLTLDLSSFRKILIVGAGKATAAMTRALREILGDRISEGIIVVPDGLKQPLGPIRAIESGHPIPDERGVAGALQMLSLLENNAQPDVLALCLISGGGSALLPCPANGITLLDKQQTTRLLLKCGASIFELNTVRKHLSKIKGGQLARAASPARIVSLILSDVVGDPLDIIASGLTAPDSSTFSDAIQILKKYEIWEKTPDSVRELLGRGIMGEQKETPKADDDCFRTVSNVLIGNNRKALEAASRRADSLGFHPLILSASLTGEAREIGAVFASVAKEIECSGNPIGPPACLLAGGETTVTVRGRGKGGRNQEAALAAAITIAGAKNIVVAAVGTDGADGPTDAAGAIVDTTSSERAVKAGLDPAEYLKHNDSYNLHQTTGDLFITGPTGTNVMDILIGLVS